MFPNTIKTTPVLGSPIPVLGMKLKQEKNAIWLFLKIYLPFNNRIPSIEFSTGSVFNWCIFKNNQIMIFPYFPSKTGMLSRTGVSFYCNGISYPGLIVSLMFI